MHDGIQPLGHDREPLQRLARHSEEVGHTATVVQAPQHAFTLTRDSAGSRSAEHPRTPSMREACASNENR
jgi:hypothetical protein